MQTNAIGFHLILFVLCICAVSVTATADTPAPRETVMCVPGELMFSEDFDSATVSERWGFKADFALRDGGLLRTNVDPTETKRVFLEDPSFHNTIIQFDFKLSGKTTDLRVVVDQYYRTAKEAIRRYDPNHLFVGDKLNANTDSLDTVLPVASRYTDVVLYQMYGRYEVQQPGLDRWARLADKPIINGDSAFTMITDTMPRPYGPVADNLAQRAAWTDEFFRSAFARPEFVGWHYCGLIDASQLVPRKQDRQHSGLLDGFGHPYLKLQQVLKAASSELYQVATK